MAVLDRGRYLRAQMRSSLEIAESIAPGEVNDYEIHLGHIHFRFQAAQSLRITISGGDVPFVIPTNPSGLVAVRHSKGTYVELPVLSA
ncbi:CocE/NonD family hydrolase C-terminal non-catalytic domain-containing protein [Pseudarthrobacter sp. S9]|uniref:CocE/NonD family hydrolase C-terminal non-catalytic domain-containing protein n=1 Tax=Pseudarthrobacter sp. S9 TaxID=3418421 RepID=UPI003D052C2B